MLQLALRFGFGRLKAGEYLADRGVIELACHARLLPKAAPLGKRCGANSAGSRKFRVASRGLLR